MAEQTKFAALSIPTPLFKKIEQRIEGLFGFPAMQPMC